MIDSSEYCSNIYTYVYIYMYEYVNGWGVIGEIVGAYLHICVRYSA